MISGDKPMLNQWGTHADALSMLLRLRANSDQFTSERSGGIARGAHGVVVSVRIGLKVDDVDHSIDFQKPSSKNSSRTRE